MGNLQGQSDPTGSRRITDTYVITGVTLIPEPGKLFTDQKILFEDGVIKAIGKILDVPSHAQEVKADSLFVYPGLIELANKTGVSKPKIPERPEDFDPSNPPPLFAGIHPYESVLDHYDPKFPHNAEWRKLGFVISHKIPMGEGFLPGQTALVVYGDPSNPNRIKENTSLYARFHTVSGLYPSTDMGVLAKLREMMENTRILEEHQNLFVSTAGVRRPERDKVLEAFIPVMKGEIPLLFEVGSELDIHKLLRLKGEINFKLILTGIEEGESSISALKKSGAGVVLNLNLPEDPSESDDWKDAEDEEVQKLNSRVMAAYHNRLSLASKFEKAGIPFAFSTKHLNKAHFHKNLRLLIENGLSQEAALSALTLNPAKMFGIEKIAGSIEVGKMANMVITTDSLFSENMEIKYVIADGYLFEYQINGETTGSLEETWKYETSTGSGQSSGKISLHNKGGKLTGDISYDDPEGTGKKNTELHNLKKSEDQMSFEFNVKVAGKDLHVKVKGEISGKTFTGNMQIMDMDSVPFKAKKIEPRKK